MITTTSPMPSSSGDFRSKATIERLFLCLSTLNSQPSTSSMNHPQIRRRALGLTIDGPFSRNRRRRPRPLTLIRAALTGLGALFFFFL